MICVSVGERRESERERGINLGLSEPLNPCTQEEDFDIMEEHLNPFAAAHLLQHTLRSLCTYESSQWVYAVFWRILPRNYPPPKWDVQGVAFDRSRGNRRNWILVWEDGFCNFAVSIIDNGEIDSKSCPGTTAYGNCEWQQQRGLQPELFFKMSHEIYNYGEGLVGKVAADHSHKWIYKEANDQEVNFLSAWHSPSDSHPRAWEAQFQCGIKTIALIAVREGVVQLGAVSKVMEDLNYVVLLREKFNYLESIPGVLLPHPSSSAFPFKVEGCSDPSPNWACNGVPTGPTQYFAVQPAHITPSMTSLEALLSKLPSVVPTPSSSSSGYHDSSMFLSFQRPMETVSSRKVAKEEVDEEYHSRTDGCVSSMPSYDHFSLADQPN